MAIHDNGGTVRAVALIGAGTIARSVGQALADGELDGFRLAGFLTRTAQSDLPGTQFASVAELLASKPAVVVEAAGHDAVRSYAEDVLSAGCTLVCCSVGALADGALRGRLLAAGGRLVVPSGAVGGLDLLAAAAAGGLDEVVVEQRKPPANVLPEDEAAALTEPAVVFDGTVAEVVGLYPKTTNVAAAVALAGLGFERTRARVVADPSVSANQVHLTARGSFGTMTLALENVPSANPRTSAIVPGSVLATLRRLTAPLVVPG
jgi:aspartate dehydrogenase